ncbi:molybdopterin cofactor-binding domain-containing protein [Sphingomicrobium nitratireducens]|uniref:molybdopterin cofactor-binding domain-containing protein n=1 Tax=Sphingomicrobium nitratireducens TaxID=2964666 RepID=UPI00223F5BBA|nr:molybdopterin cofactor-binding domain-containing protein [Sphingomicrobium nitratireducens]
MARLTRRDLLVGGGAGVGLVVAYALWPRGAPPPRFGSLSGGGASYGHYLRIAEDGQVTIAVPQVETGQGIWTALAALVAGALGADPALVGVEPLPVGAGGASNPLLADVAGVDEFRATAAATSVRAFEEAMRLSGATARAMLLAEAADRMGVEPEECSLDKGWVSAGPKRVSIGDLAAAAADRSVPNVELVDAPALPLARLDGPAKVRGSWRLAGDVRLPGLLYASARLAPRGGSILGLDRAAARARPGLIELVEREDWIAAVADTWWAADQAMQAADIRYRAAGPDGASIELSLTDRLGTSGDTLVEEGDAAGVLADADRVLRHDFLFAATPHHGLEPLTATARPTSEGGIEVWAPSQAPEAVRDAVRRVTGLPGEKVAVFPMPVGADDGRALEADAAPIAAILAIQLGRPVQLTLPHDHAALFDPLRPPLAMRIAAVPGEGRIAAWHARYASALGTTAALRRVAGKSGGGLDTDGAVPPYGIADIAVEAHEVDLPIRTGYLRGGTGALTRFAGEVMVDVVARAIGAEPLGFRIGMLGHDPALVASLRRVGELSGWDGGGIGSRMGIAAARIDGSAIALVAEAARAPDGGVEVHKLTAVFDCGRAAHTALAAQQVEGGLLSALDHATAPAPDWRAGLAHPGRRSATPTKLPAVTVERIASSAPPGGVSQLGASVLAAAIANALAAGGSEPVTRLPFTATI